MMTVGDLFDQLRALLAENTGVTRNTEVLVRVGAFKEVVREILKDDDETIPLPILTFADSVNELIVEPQDLMEVAEEGEEELRFLVVLQAGPELETPPIL